MMSKYSDPASFHRPAYRRIILATWLASAFPPSVPDTHAKADKCNGLCDTVLSPDGETDGYDCRNKNRCEGAYTIKHSSGEWVTLVSLTQGDLGFSLDKPGTVDLAPLQVDSFAGKTLHIRANSMAGRAYRMDTRIVLPGYFRWHNFYMRNLEINPKYLGIVGWVENGNRREYVPMRIAGGGDPAPGKTLLWFVSKKKFREFKWKVFSADAQVADSGAMLSDVFTGKRFSIETRALPAGPYELQLDIRWGEDWSLFYPQIRFNNGDLKTNPDSTSPPPISR